MFEQILVKFVFVYYLFKIDICQFFNLWVRVDSALTALFALISIFVGIH